MTETINHNRRAWDRQSAEGQSEWVQPVDAATIAKARKGEFGIILTPTLDVPMDWFGDLAGREVLGLASGGGQQVPVLAAAGASVTSFDLSDEQLAKDQLVADREGLDIKTVQGAMDDLSCFVGESFDLIFHPISNVFAPDIEPVWRECHRVLVPGGRLLSGFMNPDFHMFDHEAIEEGAPIEPVFKLPYTDAEDMHPDRLAAIMQAGIALEHSHSLDAQIGGQLKAGFVIAGFYEDWWANDATPLNKYMPTSMATLAIKGA
jgi:SAM-dependent methyltransferase